MRAELKLIIAGNHDPDLDRNFYSQHVNGDATTVDETIALWTSDFAISHGVRYLQEGTHRFVLHSGATFTIYASPYTPEYGISAFQYPTHSDRFNEAKSTPPWAQNNSTLTSIIPSDVDIIMTHGPPKYILDQCADPLRSSGGCEHLRRAFCRVRPLLYCFGHIHSAWGAQRVSWIEDGGNGEDGMEILPADFVGKNSCKKRGYATLGPGAYSQLFRGKQSLLVNAAVGNDGGGYMENVPWKVDLMLKMDTN